MLRQSLLALHLLGAIVWIGGMFFAHFCMRPAAVETLQPPQRLPLMAAALGRFFRYVAVAVLVLLGTGVLLMLPIGMKLAPFGWHLMYALGVVMALVFGYIYLALYPKLAAHCQGAAWPEAGQVLNRIRQLVMFNLVLGVLVVIAAAVAR